MSNLIEKKESDGLERVLIKGDLAGLSESQRLDYVKRICDSIGVSMLTQPFEYIQFQGKTVLYARKALAEQLRKIHKISIQVVSREKISDLYVVTVRASDPNGRCDESLGAINTVGLKGQELANAMMKAETKAKRRVTLSVCGLSMLDEDEVKQLVETESRNAAQAKIEEVQAKIETKVRPEFEAVSKEHPPQSAPQPPVLDYAFILEAGKLKGKDVRDLSDKKLKDWLDFYNSQIGAGKDFHELVHKDALKIQGESDDRLFDQQMLAKQLAEQAKE